VEVLIVDFLALADRGRSGLLRITTRSLFFRRVFVTRHERLAAFFGAACVLALLLSVFFPLWVLALAPLVYGVPHLYSSIRYVPRIAGAPRNPRWAQAAIALFATLALVRLFTDTQSSAFASSLTRGAGFEIVGLAIAAFGFAQLLYRTGARVSVGRTIAGLVTATTIGALAWVFPVQTLATLLLGHNLVAFFFWISGARDRANRCTALIATAIFVLATAAIFMGLFDAAYAHFRPAAALAFAQMDYASLGQSIVPWSSDYHLWFHAVVAYAFGQSLHYFVWLKAIPDATHDCEVPTSFRQSYTLLKRDFGSGTVVFILLSVAVATLAWTLLSFSAAREAYFALAAFHGYFELAGLGFALSALLPTLSSKTRALRSPL
jgi:hypothetical protein